MLFSETSLEINIKSMIYYCKYSLNKTSSSEHNSNPPNYQYKTPVSNHFIDISINNNLFPLSPNLTSLLNSTETKYTDLAIGNNNNLEYESSLSSMSASIGSTTTVSLEMNENELKYRINLLLSRKTKNKKSLFPIFFDTTVI